MKGALVSTVNGELWELGRPLEEDCELQLLGFDTVEGRQVIVPFFFILAHSDFLGIKLGLHMVSA